MKAMTSFVSFPTSPEESARLEVSATKCGLTLQSLMRQLVEDHLAAEDRQRPLGVAEVTSVLRARRSELNARGVTRISVFGTTARGENRSDSDIDLLVEISDDARMSLTGFARLRGELAEMLNRPVDLVEWRNLAPRFRRSAERDAVTVF